MPSYVWNILKPMAWNIVNIAKTAESCPNIPNACAPLFICWYIKRYDEYITAQSIQKIHQYGSDFLEKYQFDSLLKNFMFMSF